MADIRLHANRNFRRRVLSDGTQRGVDGYFAFTHDEKPRWWTDEHDRRFGEVLGVYENWPSSPLDAIILRRDGVVVLRSDRADLLRYADIHFWDQLVKEPLSESLRVHLHSGKVFEIPFPRKTGMIADFMRFLGAAKDEAQGP